MLQSDENELNCNTIMGVNSINDFHQSYGKSQIYDTAKQRSFTILPNISHMDNVYEDKIVIWLDDTIGTSVESQWFNIMGQLRRTIGNAKGFANINECLEYIGATAIEQVFLIVTGTYGDNFDASLFEEIPNGVFIYVLTTDQLLYNSNHPIIRGYFNNVNTLIDLIHDDYMAQTTKTMSDINFRRLKMNVSTSRYLNPQLIQWKCSQLMFDIVRRMPCPREQSRDRFIQLCRSYYRHKGIEQTIIHQFVTTYDSEQAIYRYTTDRFLYQLLNLSYRTNNIDAIMNFSFLTVDIYDQLHKYHYQKDVQKTSPIVVYRGQMMNMDEFQQLKFNVGGLISNNSLLSTSASCDSARCFIDNRDKTGYVRILIEILIDFNSHASKPFADVRTWSDFPAEREVLFMNGSIFRIDSCELTVENFWKIHLTLCDDSYPIVENSTDYFDIAMLQLLEILPQISPMTHKANDRMLHCWRLYCNGDSKELAKIDQFEENYRSDSAIHWYTKDSLLFRLLNTALRQENIDMIIDFRYFIVDLYDQLTKSHLDYVRSFKKEGLTVYRGQKISLLELRRFKHIVGECISIKSFFSASLSSAVALIYAKLSESDRKQFLQSILFEINIDMNRLAQPTKNHLFANIISQSCFVDEEEILFMPNTRFRIQSVTKWTPTLWIIRLTLLSLDDENTDEMKIMNEYINYLRNMIIERCGDNVRSFFLNNCVKEKLSFLF